MTRPRWHDVVIVVAISSLLVAGLWALWWDDVRHALFGTDKKPPATEPSIPANNQT